MNMMKGVDDGRELIFATHGLEIFGGGVWRTTDAHV